MRGDMRNAPHAHVALVLHDAIHASSLQVIQVSQAATIVMHVWIIQAVRFHYLKLP